MGWTTELESVTFGATTQRSTFELRPHGDYDGTRTRDLRRDRPALYATELHSHMVMREGFEPSKLRLEGAATLPIRPTHHIIHPKG